MLYIPVIIQSLVYSFYFCNEHCCKAHFRTSTSALQLVANAITKLGQVLCVNCFPFDVEVLYSVVCLAVTELKQTTDTSDTLR